MKRAFARLAPAVLALLSCACAPVPVRYEPKTLAAQLPAARLPSLYLEDVVDATGGGEYDLNHGQQVPQEWKQDLDWAAIAGEAVKLELKRLGWPVTESRVSAGARLAVTVERAWVQWSAGGVHLPVKAKVQIAVALKTADGRTVWDAQLKGNGAGIIGSGGAPDNGLREAWNAALNAAMPKLGPMLADERPWEKLDGSAPAPVAQRAQAPAALSDIDQLPPMTEPRPNTYALAIGIERYRAKLPNADYASADARLAAEYFKRVLGVPEQNVAVITDEFAAKADLEKYVERWLPNQVAKGGTVYVFYSGHGAPDPAKGDAYLVPYDSDPTYIEQTGYSLKRLYDELAKLPADHVIVALDSCFSGAGGRSVLAAGARPLVSLRAAQVPAKITVISASSGEEISTGYPEKGHGLFTYFFLKGLRDKRGDLRAAFDYATPLVARTARQEDNARQTPQWKEGR